MLLQFSIKNFRTFKEKASLSLIASNYGENTREADNIYYNEKFGLRILKSAVIYGANASGKTKLLDAFAFVSRFVMRGFGGNREGDDIDVKPFMLSAETENEPSEFEVIFIFNDVLYRYGFEATKKKILSEWLYHKPEAKEKEAELFYREEQDFNNIHETSFTKGGIVAKQGLVRENALLVSVAAQFNEEAAINVIEWFKKSTIFLGLNEAGYQVYTAHKAEYPLYKSKIIELLKAADFGIQDVQLQKRTIDELPKEIRDKIPRLANEPGIEQFFLEGALTAHKKYNSDKKSIENVNFSLNDDESSGTGKFFALAALLLDVIENGDRFVVDDLDAKLHPALVGKIVSLFNSKELNKKNAQLIFNTHDTHLLSSGLFRRDQIWFISKNKYGEAKLYSLADFKLDEDEVKKKKAEPFEDNYMRGKYGAIPYLGFFDDLNAILSQHENEEQKS